MIPKDTRYISKKYVQWVKSLDCVSCGAPADDAHHIIGEGMGGMGIKAHDWAVMPMCRWCHTEMHSGKLDINQWKHVAKTLGKHKQEGIR